MIERTKVNKHWNRPTLESLIILCQILVYGAIKRILLKWILYLLLVMISADGEKSIIIVYWQSMVMNSFIYEYIDLLMCALQDLLVSFESYKTISRYRGKFSSVVVQCSIHYNHTPLLYLLITNILGKRLLISLFLRLIFISFDSTLKELYNDIKTYWKNTGRQKVPSSILVSWIWFYTFSLLHDSFSLEIWHFWWRLNVAL